MAIFIGGPADGLRFPVNENAVSFRFPDPIPVEDDSKPTQATSKVSNYTRHIAEYPGGRIVVYAIDGMEARTAFDILASAYGGADAPED